MRPSRLFRRRKGSAPYDILIKPVPALELEVEDALLFDIPENLVDRNRVVLRMPMDPTEFIAFSNSAREERERIHPPRYEVEYDHNQAILGLIDTIETHP